jgi:hypothetical protein
MSVIPAEIKKKENIAEYIIHMYQTEDLILNYKFDLDDILQYVIQHMSNDEIAIKKLLLWYADIIDHMQRENISDSTKRLSSTQKIVDNLLVLHNELLITDKEYLQTFEKARPDIQRNSEYSKNSITNPIQICLNGIYGMLLLKLNGKKIPADDEGSLTNFGAVLGHLSITFKERANLK